MNPLYPLLAFSLLLPLCRHSMASGAFNICPYTPAIFSYTSWFKLPSTVCPPIER